MMASPYDEFPPYRSNPGPALLDGLVRYHPLTENLHLQCRHRHEQWEGCHPGKSWHQFSLAGTHEDACHVYMPNVIKLLYKVYLCTRTTLSGPYGGHQIQALLSGQI